MSSPRWLLRLARPLLPGWPDAGRKIVQNPALRALLVEAVRDRRPRVVLNAGCGEAMFAPLLLSVARPDLQIELDLSLAGGRHVRSPRQRYVCASLTHAPLQSSSIDLVLCTEVLEHIPDDDAAAGEIARVLKPGGCAVVSVPTPPAEPDLNHVREGYTLDALDGLFDAHGLTRVRTRTCMHLFFRSVLRWWRPGVFPRLAIIAAAWLDRLLPVGPPMDLLVLVQKR